MTRDILTSARRAALLATAALPLALGGCLVGPDYKRPTVLVPVQFKELRPADGWVRADPTTAAAPKGAWWTIYNDPLLSSLEDKVALNNQNVAKYEAQYREAAAAIDAARANFFPTLGVTAGDTRSYTGRGSNVSTSTATGSTVNAALDSRHGTYSTTYQVEPQASWTLDIWGQTRRQVESQGAAAQVAAATVANERLLYQSTLAQDYFELRAADANYDLLERTVAADAQSATIVGNQYRAGTSAPSAYLQAETLLANERAQLINVGVGRAQYEHAIAVLIGEAPSELGIAHGQLTQVIPPVPVTVPATLLQRRPDIAAAERTMQEQNALIGVNLAAFYPQITLSASGGFTGSPLNQVFNAAHLLWSLGASATQNIFEGGARSAAVGEARANYQAAVASYRETVLEAFQGVEDNLSGLRILSQQAVAQQQAVDFANQAVTVARNEYFAGTADYTTVVTAETTALSDAQSAISIQLSRLTDSVVLVQNLGGGWDASQIPARGAMEQSPFAISDHPLPKP